jgi:hypothetical protein
MIPFSPGANLYTQGFGSRPENIEVPHYDVRVPSSSDILFPLGKWWLYPGNSLWYLLSQSSMNGQLVSNWVQIAGGGGSGVNNVNGSNGVTASPTSGNVIVSGVNATTSTVGVASFNSLDFTVSGGQVSLIGTTPNSYTNVTSGMSPYTVTATDYFISVDCSGGPVSLIFPASPAQNRQFIIKDRLGQASTNNITVSSGAVTTIDGQPSQVMEDAYESIEMLFHGTPNNYEIF